MNNCDPTSFDYTRTYNKPKINWILVAIYIGVYFILLFILIWLVNVNFVSKKFRILIYISFSIIYLFLNLKSILILFIKIYQNLAPISIREKCRFEPSCSEYMMLSIEKYGAIKGLKKGILRLKRCNTSNGGYDYP